MRTDEDTISDLYEMVQESKRLLIKWKATSYLSKEKKLQLRRETKAYLLKSSTSIMMDYWYRKTA